MLNLPKWRLTATAAWKLLFAIIFVLVSSYFAKAQPPIPTPADAIDVPADELADQDVEEVVEAPVVRSEATQAALDAINSRNPESAIDLVNAAVIMQRLGAFPEAESFLDQAIATDMTPEETSELYRKVGTAALVRLATEKALTPRQATLFAVSSRRRSSICVRRRGSRNRSPCWVVRTTKLDERPWRNSIASVRTPFLRC